MEVHRSLPGHNLVLPHTAPESPLPHPHLALRVALLTHLTTDTFVSLPTHQEDEIYPSDRVAGRAGRDLDW